MKLSAEAHSKFENFFREFYKNEQFKLPPIYFYAGGFSKSLTAALKIHGITVGKHIFIKPEFIFLTEDDRRKIDGELAAHEIAHVLQYEREGVLKFLYKYFNDYRQNLKNKDWSRASRMDAYLEIKFEIEARHTAEQFVEWHRKNGKAKK